MAKKISQMDEAANLLDTDILPFIQSGSNKSITGEKLKAFTNDGILEGGGLSNIDLNTLVTNMNYWVTRTSISNSPADSFGYLEVIRVNSTETSYIVMQRFTVFGNDTATTRGTTYVRFFSNNQWYNWFKIAQLIT